MFTILNSYLDNGLKILLRRIPNSKTVSCGIWVNQGVKDESGPVNGISHLTEHLLFKINSRNSIRSMKENLNSLRIIGAKYNATTTKDHTSFYIDGLSRDVSRVLEVLSYIVVNKEKVDPAVLEKEKEIVLREAEGYLLSSKQIAERLGQALWGDYSYGQLVIGKTECIRNITAETVDELIETAYMPENCVLVVVGGFDYDNVLEEIIKRFSVWGDRYKRDVQYIIQSEPGIVIDDRFDGGRSTIGIGFQAYTCSDSKSRYVDILKDILTRPGARLFNEIREKRGLVYSLQGFSTSFSLAGNMGISFSANNEHIEDIIKICINEFKQVVKEGIDDSALQEIKLIRETELLYAIESTSTQLNAIGKSAIRGNLFLLEDEIRELKKINKEKMDQVIREIINTDNLSLAILGKLNVDNIISQLEF